jgi:hypothetical protein
MQVTIEDLQKTQQPSKRMLEVRKLENGKYLLEMNFSSLAIVQECLRKSQYRLLLKLTNEADSDAQVFGKAIHKALEHWYTLPEENRQLTETELKMVDSLVSGLVPESVYPTALDSIYEFVKTAEPIRFLGDDDKRSLASGIKILKAYFKQYAEDGMEVLRDSAGVPYIEKQVEGKLYEDEKLVIVFHGQIDLILRNRITGQISYSDHKTTAALGKEFYNRISPNHQYTGYVWAGNEFLGVQSDSFMVNGIQVAKTKHEFARQFTTITASDYQEMKQAYVEAAHRIVNAIERDTFPQSSPNPCSAYGGCPYLEICQAPAELRKTIIESKYGKSV